MARQLYDYWFVQFDFPDSEGKPYKSSGGKMQDGVPDSWARGPLGDLCRMYQPKTISISELSDKNTYRVYGANGVVGYYSQYNHTESEIAMACRGNSCGVLNRTMPYSWITGNAMVIQMRDNTISNEYLLQALRYANIKGAITGSGQPQLTRENLEKVRILIPPKKILLKFSAIIEPLVNIRLQIIRERDYLIKLRDELLPLLMNGQVSVRPRAVNCDLSFMYRPVESSCRMIRRTGADGEGRYVANNA